MNVKLTYTEQMKEQDVLWKKEREDFVIMEKCYKEIVSEARNKGFKGVVNIYNGACEKLIEVFETEKEQEKLSLNHDRIAYGYCKPLIKKLESIINDEKRE